MAASNITYEVHTEPSPSTKNEFLPPSTSENRISRVSWKDSKFCDFFFFRRFLSNPCRGYVQYFAGTNHDRNPEKQNAKKLAFRQVRLPHFAHVRCSFLALVRATLYGDVFMLRSQLPDKKRKKNHVAKTHTKQKF